MRLAEHIARLALVLSIGFLPAACKDRSDEAVEMVAIGQPASPYETGGRLSPPARLIRGATAEGLVSLDEQGRAVPAVADRWIVTDDGLSYIFRLRNGTWPDGSPISAESGRQALRDAIAALRGSPMALDLSVIAEIRVMAGRVVEVRLARPQPDFLTLLAQPELGLMHRGKGAGPMALTRDKAVAVLSPIPPEKQGLPAVEGWSARARELRLQALPAQQAVALFAEGKVSIVNGGTFANLPLVDAAGISRGALKIDPVSGLFGFVVVNAKGFLSTPANREAVAMAIDRDSMDETIGIGGWQAATRVVPAEAGGDLLAPAGRWDTLTPAGRRDLAKSRVQRWNAGKSAPVPLRIALPQGPGADRLFTQLSRDLYDVGIQAVRVGEGGPADLKLLDTVAPYMRASWFFNQLNCAAGRGLCDGEVDRTFAAALATQPAEARVALLRDAVTKLTDANLFIPLGQPVRWSLVGGDATGFAPNRMAYHPLMPLALLPK